MSDPNADGERLPEEPGWRPERETESSADPGELDPESLGPDVPSAPDIGEVENSEVIQLFWKLVLVFNVAILALAVGPMFAFFDGRWELGSQLFFLGVITFAYGTVRYYRLRAVKDEATEHNG